MAPRNKAIGHVPPSGNANVPTPPIRFGETAVDAKNVAARDKREGLAPVAASQSSSKAASTRAGKPQTRQSRGFFGFIFSFLTRIFALYVAVGALFQCGSSPLRFDFKKDDSRGLCRNLAFAKANLVPVVKPIGDAVYAKVDPYTGPYIKAATPYTRAAWKTTKPYYVQGQKRGKALYNRHLEPVRKRTVKRGRAYADPHIKNFNAQYKKQVQPHLDNLQKTVKPYQDIYTRDVAPYLSQAYAYSLTASHTSYTFYVNQVHPLVVSSLQQTHAFYINHADPAMRRAYSLYVRPQIDRVLAKVFERKAHATTSEAIRQTKQDVKEARKEGDAKGSAAIEEAAASARKTQEDPSIVDRIKQGAAAAVGNKEEEDEDPIELAKLDAELDAELEKIGEQLDAWLIGLKNLENQEYVLVTQRIAELRNRKLADLPDHFATLSETHVEEEAASILVKLEKVFAKLSIDASKPSSSSTLDDRLTKARKAIDEQLAKLDASEATLQSLVTAYATDLTKDEARAVKASSNEIKRFIKEAAKSFDRIMGEAKFERSVEEFEGWDDGLAKRALFFREELQGLVAGKAPYRSSVVENTTDLRKEPKLDRHIDELHKHVTTLYAAARSQVDSYASTGLLQLQGQGSLRAIADVRDSIVEQARSVSEAAATSMYAAAIAARSKLGMGSNDEDKAQGILARVSDQARAASQSIASAASAATGATAQSKSDAVRDRIGSAYEAASSQVNDAAVAAGVVSEPKGNLEKIKDAYDEAAKQAGQTYDEGVKQAGQGYDAAASQVSDIAASASEAGQSASSYMASVAGQSPSPSSPLSVVGDYVEQAASSAQDGLKSASSLASSAVGGAGGSGAAAATGSVPERAGEYVEHAAGVVGDAAASVYDSAAELGSSGLESSKDAVQGAYDSVKEAVAGGEEPSVVGKNADAKDFNTVGKAVKDVKDHVVDRIHQEL